jgi:lipoprotein-releasing system permease protein
MKSLPVEWIIALRFLREGRMQTVLILAGVTLGAAVIVYISALITGLQKNIIDRTLGTQAHIVVKPPEDNVSTVLTLPPGTGRLAATQKRAQRLQGINEWQKILADIRTLPDITASAVMANGSGFVVRGDATKAVAIIGIDPEEYGKIVDFPRRMVAGEFRLANDQIVIGLQLAEDMGIGVGDKLRLVSSINRDQVFTVSGIFDLGLRDLNRRWAVVPVRAAQTLLDLPGLVTQIELRVSDIFEVTDLSERIAARHDVIAENWMQANSQLMTGLRSQSASSWMIRIFVTISVAFGIASVLVVSVVQKSREIGILRAMGISSRSILVIFLIQGGIVGFSGSLLGLALGGSWAIFFSTLITNPDGTPVFQITLSPGLFIGAMITATLTGLLAAAAPARSAARLDPVVAIRHV